MLWPGGIRVATVVKVLELVGESRRSWQDAAESAVREASQTVDQITGVEVYNMTAEVEDGKLTSFKANVKVAFTVDPNRR
ncbi:MAG TPA: dodecin family protein [Bacillota bacterium]|nr:dodecin family protein [Bacillota bacterium]